MKDKLLYLKFIGWLAGGLTLGHVISVAGDVHWIYMPLGIGGLALMLFCGGSKE